MTNYYVGELIVEPQVSDWPAEFELMDEAVIAGGFDPFECPFFLENVDGAMDVGIKPDGSIGIIGEPGKTRVSIRFDDATTTPADEMEPPLKDLLAWIEGQGSSANGIFAIHGEQHLDEARFRVENNVVQYERPKLVWPNGDTEDL